MRAKTYISLLLFAGAVSLAAGPALPADPLAAADQDKSIRHIVLIAFKEGTSPQIIAEIMQAAANMPREISEIESLEWGSEMAVTPRAQGFTHCLNLTFKNRADLETYLPHPAHEAFKEKAMPHVEKLLVFDYLPNQ